MTLEEIVTLCAFAALLFALSATLSWLISRHGVLDEPNHRSSHERPTPSGGGLAIVATAAAGFAIVWLAGLRTGLAGVHLAGFAAGAAGMAAVGYVDDLKLLRTFAVKLAAQVAAAALLTLSGIVVMRLWVPGLGVVDIGWLGYPLTVLWIVALTNIFNFMDGLNGLAGGTAVIVAVFLGAVTFVEGSGFVHVFCYVIAAASAGFLVFNFPRAHLFMGDVGSQFLGFSFAALAVIAAEADTSRTSLLVVPLLFFNFLFDTGFTLCRRALRGENVTSAHRGHLYQLLNRLGWSHVRVSLFHYAVAAAQGIGAVVMAEVAPDRRILVFVPFAVFQILYAAIVMRRARAHGLLD